MIKRLLLLILAALLIQPINVASENKSKQKVITLESIQNDILKNSDILILSYKWSSLHYQEEATEESLDDITVPGLYLTPRLPTDFDYFLTFYPGYSEMSPEEQGQINEIIMTKIQINSSMNQMIEIDNHQAIAQRDAYLDQIDAQKKQLRNMLKELNTQLKVTSIQEEEAKAGAKLYIQTLYISLLSLKEQMKINGLELEELNEELGRNEKLKEVGLVTERSLLEISDRVSDAKRKQQKTIDQYELNLTHFLLDLNYDLEDTYKLEQIEMPIFEEVSQPTDKEITTMANGLFQLKMVDENRKLAESQYNRSSGSSRKQAEYQLKMVKEQKKSLHKEMKKKIYAKYQAYKQSYNDFTTMKETYKSLQIEKEYIDKQYRLGLLPEYEKTMYEQYLEKYKVELTMKEFELFIGKQEEIALEKGYIN